MMKRVLLLMALLLSMIMLAACGGGGDDTPTPIAATPGNSAPVADAGPNQKITTLVTLDGSASSDADGDPLTYNWSLASVPTNSTATLSDPSVVNPTFIADRAGPYVAQLIVNDGTVDSVAAVVVIVAHRGYLSDTGQSTGYTDTNGEDADYLTYQPTYTLHDDGTTTDYVTGLMWQSDGGNDLTWNDAATYCASLTLAGLTDWRLPTDKELQSIVDHGVFGPAIDQAYFPATNLSNYWSSTLYYFNPAARAWVIDFNYGFVTYSSKADPASARCVRGGQ